MFSRPRSRLEQEELERKPGPVPPREAMKQAQRISPSVSMHDSGRAPSSSDKKGPKSEYDFPDSPDDEAKGKPLSSYMALSSSTRSPRRGIVDSSENRMQSGAESGREGDGNVESSEDVGQSESKVTDSGAGKDNEAQGFERFGSDQAVESSKAMESGRKVDETQVYGRFGISPAQRKHSTEADEGSNISQTSADSTDRLMVDESANIDSSGPGEVSSVSQSRRSSKSSRESDNSPHCSSEFSSAEHVGHGRQGHRSRSPRSYPQTSSELGSSVAAASSMQYSRRVGESDNQETRDQEPQPLLSSQYETLSDDDQS